MNFIPKGMWFRLQLNWSVKKPLNMTYQIKFLKVLQIDGKGDDLKRHITNMPVIIRCETRRRYIILFVTQFSKIVGRLYLGLVSFDDRLLR